MDLGLGGKVALVAAASRGLGRAVAEELAREGVHLVICARGAAVLSEAAARIRELTGARVSEVVADLSEAEGVARVARCALEDYGRVDVLVTNGGVRPPARSRAIRRRRGTRPFARISTASWSLREQCCPA